MLHKKYFFITLKTKKDLNSSKERVFFHIKSKKKMDFKEKKKIKNFFKKFYLKLLKKSEKKIIQRFLFKKKKWIFYLDIYIKKKMNSVYSFAKITSIKRKTLNDNKKKILRLIRKIEFLSFNLSIINSQKNTYSSEKLKKLLKVINSDIRNFMTKIKIYFKN